MTQELLYQMLLLEGVISTTPSPFLGYLRSKGPGANSIKFCLVLRGLLRYCLHEIYNNCRHEGHQGKICTESEYRRDVFHTD
jgi:hypothetical protein